MPHIAFHPHIPAASGFPRIRTALPWSYLLAICLTLPCGQRAADAQTDFVVTAPAVAPGIRPQGTDRPIQNLKEGLEVTAWAADRRGPLLALDPAQVRAWMPEREPGDWYTPQEAPQPLRSPANGQGLNSDTVAKYFGRKVIRVGTLSVLAPTEMILFHTNLPKPDPLRGLRRSEKMTLFQALLNDSQWQKLCSEQGLGLGDLDKDQKELFLSLLPNPVRVIQYKPHFSGGNQIVYPGIPEGQYPSRPVDPRTTLTEAQRQTIRLRINRMTTMSIPSSNSTPGSFGGGVYVENQVQGSNPWFSLASGEEFGQWDAYGIRIREKVASRLKQGHLNFDDPVLNAAVSLTDVKTVSELMERIRQATRYEIYADSRVGRLPIGGVGIEGTVRSGDVLKALAWAVTGAYRRVGPVFILTDDVIGIGTRLAQLSAWEQQGTAGKRALLEKARRQIQAKKPMQYTRFSADDPMALNDEMMKRIESKWTSYIGRYQGEQLRLLDLPPVMQENARKSIENHLRSDPNGRSPILTDRVQVNVQVRPSLIIPGMGVVKADNFGWYDAMSSMLPPPENPEFYPGRTPPSSNPAIIPARMKAGGILYVAPRTAEETEIAAETARQRGMKQLWVLLPLDHAEGKKILAAAIKAGKGRGIPVYAALRLMVAPSVQPIPTQPPVIDANRVNGLPLNSTPVPEDRDRNVLGETASMALVRQMSVPEPWVGFFPPFLNSGDWLRPDAPLTLPSVKNRVLTIAQTPGLAGIVLRDLLPSGYESATRINYYYGSAGDYGYTEGNRVAMIRKESIDPVDLNGPVNTETNVDLPFFRRQTRRWITQTDGSIRMDTSTKDPSEAWAKMRFDIGMQTLKDLYKYVRSEIPAQIPIIASQIAAGGAGWYGTWDAAEKIPAQVNTPVQFLANGESYPGPTKRPVETARTFSRSVYASVMMYRITGNIPEMAFGNLKYGTPAFLARSINEVLEPEAKFPTTWDGLVLDMTDYPLSEVKELVLGALAPSKQLDRSE